MEDFEEKSFDLNLLAGQAETSYNGNTTANSELEIIRKACLSKSSQMKENYKVEHDGRPFSSRKDQQKDGTTITKINFGFEVKTTE